MPGITDNLLTATFRGVPFLWRGLTTEEGRKIAVFEYPNRDTRFAEDLGLLPGTFHVDGLIAQRRSGEGYFEQRDALRTALKEPGPGVLVHPTLGQAEVVALPFSMNERQGSLGVAEFRMSFLASEDIGNPEPIVAGEPQVEADTETVVQATTLDVLNDFLVSSLIPQNVSDGVDLLLDISRSMRGSLAQVSTLVAEVVGFPTATALAFASEGALLQQQLARFLSLADTFDNNISLHLTSSEDLGRDIVDLAEQFDLVPSTPVDGLRAATIVFDTAPGADVAPITFASAERRSFNDVVRRTMRIIGYALSSRNAAKIDYGNTTELDTVRTELERQFDILETEDLEDTQVAHLKTLRDHIQVLFDQVEVSVFRVGPVATEETSALLLAFQYYGNDAEARSANILNLNRTVDNAAFIPKGTVEVLLA